MSNRKLGKYDIRDRLGRGGMAEVYRAYHSNLDRFVAIKVLHAFLADDPEFKMRFEREAQNVAKLRHPNIVQVYDFDYDDESESYYMVMEMVDGPTLKDWLVTLTKQGELLPMSEAVRIVREAAGALAYAHSRSMIHRDVKPANLMLDHDKRVVLTDFGIAKIVTGAQFTASGGMVGTPAYMAPEQGLGEAGDERSDLYSLGVILFQLTTGRLPYDAETPLAIILKHLNAPIPSVRELNPALPEAIEQIIQKAMAKEPQDRYQSANDFIEDLQRLERGEVVNASLEASAAQLQSGNHDTVKVPSPIAATNETVPKNTSGPPLKRPPQRRVPWWGWAGILVGLVASVFLIGAASGIFSTGSPTQPPLISDNPSPSGVKTASSSGVSSSVPSQAPLLSTWTATATSRPSATSSPTSTATLSPTPTSTPLTPIAQTRNGIVMRVGPALNYAVNGNIQTGEQLQIIGRSKDSLWFQVIAPNQQSGWVASRDVDAYGNTLAVPVVDGPTLTPSNTPTITATSTPSFTPTITFTPAPSNTPVPNVTKTLAAATAFAAQQTATATACLWDYAIFAEDPPDAIRHISGQGDTTPQPVPAGKPYTRQITLQNTGTCAWEVNTALKFISGSGESFDAGPRIFLRDAQGQPVRVAVGDTVILTFDGQTPAKGDLYTGMWELVTPGQIRIGDPLQISVRTYEGG